MPSISIITPWHGETGGLLQDYYQAVQGAQVVSVDNACPEATAHALAEMTAHMGGVYLRNEENRGFAAANNQGYAQATGDIIVFLNSDVAPTDPWLAAVAADVKPGSLYGPSLGAQLVAGQHVPYLEGWCVAATRETWERLLPDFGKPIIKMQEDISDEKLAAIKAEIKEAFGGKRRAVLVPTRTKFEYHTLQPAGPWDALAYPGPYWEDNDLCLRALQAGLSLVQTTWPIAHKGGQTAGPITRHAASFAANEHTFTQRVLAAQSPPSTSPTYGAYLHHYATQSDIQAHLGLLYSYARGTVVELGTRTGVSTTALLAGVEARGGQVISVDLEDCSSLFQHPQWTFIRSDSRNPDLPTGLAPVDVLLIDTEHTYEICSAELALWAPHVRSGGVILLHDPETFPGVRRAITDFCARTGWGVTFVLPCNGMAIINVPEA